MNSFALSRAETAKREMRLQMRAAVEAFREYAIASLAGDLADRGVDYDNMTLLEQHREYERSALPLKLFYGWLQEDMTSICVTDNCATLQ